MKLVSFLVAIALVFVAGCAKKAEEPVSEEVISEELAPSLETQASQTPQIVQPQIAGTPVASEAQPTGAVALEPANQPVVSEKPTIESIQQALKNAGLYSGKIDGVLGPKTKKAIETFQAKNNLKVDGKVGPKTWEKLKTYLSKP
jgi:peptidoglycan hydrolase-like protein with peptidoglycan-binding domain